MTITSVLRCIEPGRKIEGISAVLLPFDQTGAVDIESFKSNVQRTLAAGITPAINMDTGYTNLLSSEERTNILRAATEVTRGKSFVAGAFVEGQTGDPASLYGKAIEEIVSFGGTPILFQSSQLKRLEPKKLIEFYKDIAKRCEKLLAFELGEMFVPFGQIYSLAIVEELMQISQLVGMKHSSLNRELEWQRLELRDRVRPEFKIYTGNDLAIDMVMYGSDYLLGLSAFAPEAFAARDAYWASGDARFYELNDILQYLGCFAFRAPVPAYKHSAAQFLKLRGRIKTDLPHPKAARRPKSDIEILQQISDRIDQLLESQPFTGR